jgi:ATP-binding cassette subfamily F protein uup
MEVASGVPSGKLVAELTEVSKSFTQPDGSVRTVIQNFTGTLLRGDKIGLLGPNGAGKTTLLKLILGELEADSGEVRRGTKMEVAYFDQMRDALDLDATLEDFISPGSEWIEIGSKRQHVKSYLGDFLFSPARGTSPVRSLSGGERNRLLLARLFARPANVLVLDEPTNDLDIETLELLEELLQTYEGTVFLVSHDRAFMDNVVTGIIACESAPDQPGFWREYEGSVQDWLVQSKRAQALRAQNATREANATRVTTTDHNSPAPVATSSVANSQVAPATASPARSKLSYKEQRELAELPIKIESMEKEQAATRAQLADAGIYQRDPGLAQQLFRRDTELDDLLMAALERWEILSNR